MLIEALSDYISTSRQPS